MRKLAITTAATLALISPVLAGGSSTDALKVEPGNAPTQAMSNETPTITGSTKADEHTATKQMDEAVAPMKPDDTAASTNKDAIKVQPGNAPTKAMSEETPAMEGSKNADEQAATSSMGKAVPTMEPEGEAKTSGPGETTN